MTSPFALQSIFSGRSIVDIPLFTRPVLLSTKDRELRQRENPKPLTTGKSHSGGKDSMRAVAGGNSSRPTGSFHFPRPQTQTRGHFYFGSNRTFLFWLDSKPGDTCIPILYGVSFRSVPFQASFCVTSSGSQSEAFLIFPQMSNTASPPAEPGAYPK